jgi:hypothetical protein
MGCGGACAVLVGYVMMSFLTSQFVRLRCPGALLANGRGNAPSCCCKHEYKLSNEIGIELLQQVKKIIPLQLASYNILWQNKNRKVSG